jgi:hypothetical protein
VFFDSTKPYTYLYEGERCPAPGDIAVIESEGEWQVARVRGAGNPIKYTQSATKYIAAVVDVDTWNAQKYFRKEQKQSSKRIKDIVRNMDATDIGCIVKTAIENLEK